MKKEVDLSEEYHLRLSDNTVSVDDVIKELTDMKKKILSEHNEFEDVMVSIDHYEDYGGCSCGQCGPESSWVQADFYGVREETKEEEEIRIEREHQWEIEQKRREIKELERKQKQEDEKREKDLALLKQLQEKYLTTNS